MYFRAVSMSILSNFVNELFIKFFSNTKCVYLDPLLYFRDHFKHLDSVRDHSIGQNKNSSFVFLRILDNMDSLLDRPNHCSSSIVCCHAIYHLKSLINIPLSVLKNSVNFAAFITGSEMKLTIPHIVWSQTKVKLTNIPKAHDRESAANG
jgi:hypothetical protein